MLSINKLENYKNKLLSFLASINNFFQKPIFKKIGFGLIIIVSFWLIYLLNTLHPLFGDDWMYSMLPNSSERIKSFGDILHTQYEHYFTWGGRSVVHVIAQSLLLSGTAVGDLLNSLAYVGFTLVIYYICNQSNTIRPSLLLVINLLIWFFQPAFGSTILWITGSANYLWGTFIILLFLTPYIKYVYKSEEKNNPLKAILMFPFGIIAGWTNENMAVALIFMIIVLLFFYKARINKIPTWAIMGAIGAIIGCIFMVAAPGNYFRMNAILSESASETPFIVIYFGRLVEAIKAYYFYALGVTFIYCITLTTYHTYGRPNNKSKVVFLSLLFFIGAIVATLAMSGAPIFPGRASFGLITFVIIAIGILCANMDLSKTIIKRLRYIILSFTLLIFISDYKGAYRTLKEVDQRLQVRLTALEKGKQAGQTDFLFNDRISIDSRFFHYFELSFDPTNWHNQKFCEYYNIHSIIVK
jgi:hypothetical protein